MSESTAPQLVQYECRNRVAILRLNRPEKLNAFNDDLVRALAAALRQFDTDPEAYVAIICGNGRAFSSGADVYQRQLRPREELERLGGPQGEGARGGDLLTRSVNWKPLVAAVHGYVLGMGLGLVLECDLIVAETGTKMQVTETSRGLGGSKYWGLLNFRGAAAFGTEISMTGRYFTADEAFAANIINRLTPKGKFMDAAMELALAVAENPPLSVRATVRTRRWQISQIEQETTMQNSGLKLHLSEDFHEAALAFKEKRKAGPFKGR
jgi:enoyl-CoA hydratase/carnithine racemase